MIFCKVFCPKYSELVNCQYFQKILSCCIDSFDVVRHLCKLQFCPGINFNLMLLGMCRYSQNFRKYTSFKNFLKGVSVGSNHVMLAFKFTCNKFLKTNHPQLVVL